MVNSWNGVKVARIRKTKKSNINNKTKKRNTKKVKLKIRISSKYHIQNNLEIQNGNLLEKEFSKFVVKNAKDVKFQQICKYIILNTKRNITHGNILLMKF